jgi:uncharacterized protein DUF4153
LRFKALYKKTNDMSRLHPKILVTIAGAFLFNFLFWNEKLALNMLLFDLFIVVSIFKLYPGTLLKPGVKALCLAHIVAIALVVVQGTDLSILAAVVTLILLVGFAEHLHRSVIYAAASMFYQTASVVPAFISLFRNRSSGGSVKRQNRSRLRLFFFPIGLVFLFFVLYFGANEAFAALVNSVTSSVSAYLYKVFGDISFVRLPFIIFGGYVTGMLIINKRISKYADRELAQSDKLLRVKRKYDSQQFSIFDEIVSAFMGSFARGAMALKNKNLIGLITLVLLNTLLLILNITDVFYIWWGKNFGQTTELAEKLHEGTGLLIVSIVFAIIVVLFFFKGNLNFYKGNKKLKQAAFVWVAQNAFLTCSVLMRDFYYISHYGLAYKRIGLLFFLALVLVGLVSVCIKIYYRKSNYFLFRVNGNVLVFTLVLASLQNWDVLIARYNISRIDSIKPDLHFLLELSDQTLPVLRDNMAQISRHAERANFRYLSGNNVESLDLNGILTERETRFLDEYENEGWLSWNFADAMTYRKLRNKTPAAQYSEGGQRHAYVPALQNR